MKSTAINDFNYTGIVSLSQYTNGKKTLLARLHNEGGATLFSFLADCLCGDFAAAKTTRPTKIMLLRTTFDEEARIKNINSASGFIYLLAKPEKLYVESTATTSKVSFNFIIARDILEGSDFNSIGLYADNATLSSINNFAAFCDITGLLNNSSIAASSVLVVDWELSISNLPSQSGLK